MISQFWHRTAKRWRASQARHRLTSDHTIQMMASDQLIATYEALQREAIIRSQNPETIRHVELIGKAIHFFVLADRDLQMLSFPYEEPWHDELHNLHFRVQALIIYEVLQRRNAVAGADLRAILSAHNLGSTILKLNEQNSKLSDIGRRYNAQLKQIRNTVIAHRDAIDPAHR